MMQTPWLFLTALAVAFILAALLTGCCRLYAKSKGLMDVPGQRSSHTIPTPRGGGLGIALAFYSVALLALLAGVSDSSLWLLPSVILVVLGLWDDHGHAPAFIRFVTHILVAIAAVYLIGTPDIKIGGISLNLGLLDELLMVLLLVWLFNLYNFMDGINGIATLEAISVALGLMVVAALAGVVDNSWILLVALLGACGGFLFWNFPRARIFLGDTGSVFLGYVLIAIILLQASTHVSIFWAGLILLGVFMVDASYTLIRRMLAGEKFWQAHRSHAYQHAARRFRSHTRVSLGVVVINLGWLLPIAGLVMLEYLAGFTGLVVAYVPLVVLAGYCGAGVEGEPPVT